MSAPLGTLNGVPVPSLCGPATPSPISPTFSEFPRRNYASSVSTSSTYHSAVPPSPQTPHSQASLGSNNNPRYSIDVSLDNMTVYVSNLPHSQFKTTLETVARKLHQAMRATRKNHKDFYFWVCDFLGSLTHAIEMFGPVPKPQYIRDFTQVSWILTILEPFLLLALDKSIRQPLGHAQITAFTETCVVLKSVVSRYRKLPCIYKDLIEELWDLIIEILAETDQGIIINYSFSLCQTIIAKVPLCDELICKLVLVRSITINYGAPRMTRFRILHARLLESLVLRAQKTHEPQFIDDISSEIVRCIATETDLEALEAFKRTLAVAQGKRPVNYIKQVTSVADFRMQPSREVIVPHQSDSPQGRKVHRKDPHVKSIFGTRARISMHSSHSTQSSSGNSTLRKSISKPELLHAQTTNSSRPRVQFKIPETEFENEVSFEGYREFRVSMRKAIVTKLRSWRNVLNRDLA